MNAEWKYLRGALVVVAAVAAAATGGWVVSAAVHDETGSYDLERMRICLVFEKNASLQPTRDLIALSADLGAFRTSIEANGVTVSVSSSRERAERIVAAYRSVGGDLKGRLESRKTTVYLWDGPAERTQRQALFDCTY